MRLPGFVAEASLLGIASSRDRRTAGRGARHFRQTPGTITPQQGLRVDALSELGTFRFPCRQLCEDDQRVAREQCGRGCAKFLTSAPSLWSPCMNRCFIGEDFKGDDNLGTVPGNPVLRPGYCDARCGGLAARLHIPLHFVWR